MNSKSRKRVLRFFNRCLPVILAGTSLSQVTAQENVSDSVRVENASFVMVGDTVIITFDLVAPPEALFDVAIELRKSADTTFVVKPLSLGGAVGRVRGGGQKAIFWNYKRDVPATFPYASDYWFEITATPFEEGLHLKWWHYAAGGLGVVAGVFILSGSGDVESSPGVSGLPDPPGIRPTDR